MKNKTAFIPADILVPQDADMTKWAVVACDQFTSQKEYWEETDRIAGDSPSALRLILPEAYLSSPDAAERIEKINSTMDKYLENGVFREYKDSFIYVRRTDSTGKLREGIVGMIDLEEYDYNKGSTSLVRATEATVAERIPPRLKVREGAALELPHIMILIDDPDMTVIEPLAERSLETIYDFDLMQGGGHIQGKLLDGDSAQGVEDALEALGTKDSFEKRSGVKNVPVLLYAMGDGNHSLATAKEYYDQKKRRFPDKDMSKDPARYALCEIVNLHSPALEFEAIHRIITGIDKEDFVRSITEKLGLTEGADSEQVITVITGSGEKTCSVTAPTSNLAVGSVQQFIDAYIKEKGGEVDYIHGADVVRQLAKNDGVGILLPDMEKSQLFPTVIKDGALPRKTFSMGHAEDKRYYIEARKIR